MRSVTKAISRPFQAKSHGHEPLSRCVAATVVSAAVLNSDWMMPFGQMTRTTSAAAASPRPKWTTGASIVRFCSVEAGAHLDLAADAEGVDALVAGGGRRARPQRLPVVGLRPAALRARRAPVLGHAQELEAAVAVEVGRGARAEGQRRRPAPRRLPRRRRAARARPPARPRTRSARAVVVEVGHQEPREPGASARGQSPRRARSSASPSAAPSSAEREPHDGAVGADAEHVEAARRRSPRPRPGPRAFGRPAGSGSARKTPPRRFRQTCTRPSASSERRVRHAVAVEVAPGEAAQARDAGERPLLGERAVAVVAQHQRRALDRGQHHVEVALGVDVGRPGAERGRAQERGRELRRAAVTSAKRPPSSWRSSFTPPAPASSEVRAVVVVEVGGDDAERRRRRAARRPGTRPLSAARQLHLVGAGRDHDRRPFAVEPHRRHARRPRPGPSSALHVEGQRRRRGGAGCGSGFAQGQEPRRAARRPRCAACSRRRGRGGTRARAARTFFRNATRVAAAPRVGRPPSAAPRAAPAPPPARLATPRRAERWPCAAPAASPRLAARRAHSRRAARFSVRASSDSSTRWASRGALGTALALEVEGQRVRRLAGRPGRGAAALFQCPIASGRRPWRLSRSASSRWTAALFGASSAAFASLRRRRVQLLLPHEEQAEVRPAGRLGRHERGHALELPPREHVLAGLHRGERGVEGGDRLAVGGLGHLEAAPAGRRRGDQADEKEDDDEGASRHRTVLYQTERGPRPRLRRVGLFAAAALR